MIKGNDIYGFFDNIECDLVVKYYNQLRSAGCIVEIGSLMGRSTVMFAENIPNTKIYAIDPWDSTIYTSLSPIVFNRYKTNGKIPDFNVAYIEFLKNTAPFPSIIPLRGKSEQFAAGFNEPIKMLFIDGCHEFEYVYKDYTLWEDKVVSGGMLVFHDCSPSWPGIMSTAETCERSGKYIRIPETAWVTVIFVKR